MWFAGFHATCQTRVLRALADTGHSVGKSPRQSRRGIKSQVSGLEQEKHDFPYMMKGYHVAKHCTDGSVAIPNGAPPHVQDEVARLTKELRTLQQKERRQRRHDANCGLSDRSVMLVLSLYFSSNYDMDLAQRICLVVQKRQSGKQKKGQAPGTIPNSGLVCASGY